MPKSKIGSTRPYWQDPEIITPARYEIFIRDTLLCDVEFVPAPSPSKPDKNQVLGRLIFQITGHERILYNIYAYDAQQFGADPYQMAKKRTGWHEEMLKAWGVTPVSKEELHSKYIHLLHSWEEQSNQVPQFRYHTNMLCGYSWSESADGITTVRYARDIKLVTCPQCKKKWATAQPEQGNAASSLEEP